MLCVNVLPAFSGNVARMNTNEHESGFRFSKLLCYSIGKAFRSFLSDRNTKTRAPFTLKDKTKSKKKIITTVHQRPVPLVLRLSEDFEALTAATLTPQ